MKSFLVHTAVFICFIAIAVGSVAISTAHAADLEVTTGREGASGCYVDQTDGTWVQNNGDNRICTYDTTYAIIGLEGVTCGDNTEQAYHNFGAAFDSADIEASSGTWTFNFWGSSDLDFVETTCASPPPGPTTLEATSTIDQTQQNTWNAYYAFLAIVFMVLWLGRSNK